ncbi:alpha/beta hydrolase [Burkholderia pseudomultivorans]|uniref:Carboxylesterase NlhH n=1 Tax=Burkholderia pseudomultivorans TaxID=1207504 RepID=A0ABU2E6G0_9BURK|nr:alpha/beta hydrolase [Burkholderia pseudomultivorans]MDR8727979.1 Carboxylesterase NlhH [Burkholderia pseudomultivorans]MDR8734090.1 Carboxylesterase NlhH [Burkholderia pseudomultivorans]MDR8743684.1 Carboxylesterase NlhH [Burkholderia pseudomultivorans]MDR8755466.1 Carboxylesterase NlhH [Burkholderia pseudomultivorans]MDR8779720.1 Carboxylesterase NlhH [Burkholderia pseudomultivorans]
MPLDPQAQALLAAFAQAPAIAFDRLTVPAYRASLAAGGAFAPGDAIASEEDWQVPAPGRRLAARLYRPDADGPLPLTVFFHGGGFVACGIDSHANLCRSLARRARTLVLSVDYRLAPEARFPAAAHDACDAVRWAAASARDLGARAGAIAVAGDSAGGNLAAVAALQLRGSGIAIAHQLLLYPVVDCATEHPSYASLGDGYFLTADMMRWFKRQYFDDGADRASPLASPLAAPDIAGAAPATIVSAEFDPLRDEAEAYALRLAQAGTPVTLVRWPGQLHGFASMLGAVDAADRVLSFGADALRRAFDATEAR